MAYEYLFITFGILIIAFLVDRFALGGRIFKKWKALLFTYVFGFILVLIWDNLAIARGHWWYNNQCLTGIKMGFVPIETFILLADFILVSVLAWEYKNKI
jgi:lycopene cyclase domain-containing protein